MKKLFIILVMSSLLFACNGGNDGDNKNLASNTAIPSVQLNAVANSDGTYTVSWDASFNNNPRYLIVSVVYANKYRGQQAYGLYEFGNQWPEEIPVEKTGSITLHPHVNAAWATVMAYACEQTGPEADEYVCGPMVSKTIKLK